MRRWILVAMLAAMAVRAQAARRVTVEQLRQFLAEQRAANKPDGDTAAKVVGLELSEQLTGPRSTAWWQIRRQGRRRHRLWQFWQTPRHFLSRRPANCLRRRRPILLLNG